MQFEWNHEKAEINLKKYNVGFSADEMVLGDSLAKIFDDEEPSFDKKR